MSDGEDDDENVNKDEDLGWLHKILDKVVIVNEDEWDDVVENVYYCAHDINKFLRILSDLPLWSNILVIIFGSAYTTATSQDVESNFRTIKNLVLDQKMVRADKFLAQHAKYLRVEIKARTAELVRGRKKKRLSPDKGRWIFKKKIVGSNQPMLHFAII